MRAITQPFVFSVFIVLFTACAVMPELSPINTPTSAPEIPASRASDVDRAVIDIVAKDLDVEEEIISVISVEAVDWPDATLGCSQPGIVGAQVITPGYAVVVEVDGQRYNVHMDASGHGLVCLD